MLTLQQIKANPEDIIKRLAVKGFDGKEVIAQVIALDTRRRELQLKNDTQASELKKLAATIGALMKKGDKAEAEKAKETVAELKEGQKKIDDGTLETRTAYEVSIGKLEVFEDGLRIL